jgi:phage-related protein
VANDEIGDVSVGVEADATGLPADLKRQVTPAGLVAGDDLADALGEAFAAAAGNAIAEGLREILAEVRGMVVQVETNPTYQPDIEVGADTEAALAEIRAFVELADTQTAEMDLDLETEAALGHLKAFAEQVEGYDLNVDLDVFLKDAQAHVAAFIAQQSAQDIDVDVDADTTPARTALQAFLAYAQRLDADLEITADLKAAAVKLAIFTRDRFVTIVPKVSMAALALVGATITATLQASLITAGIGSLSGVLLNASAALLSIGSSLAAILPGALIIPGLLIAAAAAIGPLVVGIKGLKDQIPELTGFLSGMKTTIQDAFNAEAVAPIREAVRQLGPELNEFLGPVSTSLGSLIGGLASEFGKQLGDGGLRGMLSNLAPAIDVLSQNNGVFVDTFIRLGAVANEFLVPIAGFINDIGTSFNSWLSGVQASGELSEMLKNAWFQASELGRALMAFGGIFSGLSDAAQAAGAGGLTGLADTLGAIRDVINSPEFQSTLTAFFAASGVAASALSSAIQAVGRLLVGLEEPISTLIGGGGAAIAGLLESLANALNTPAVADGLQSAMEGIIVGINAISAVLPSVIPLLTPLLDLFGQLASTVGPIVAAVLQAIAPVLGAVATALGPIVDLLGGGVIDALGAFASGFSAVATPAAGLQGILEGLFAGLAGLVSTLLPLIVQLLVQVVQAIAASLPSIVTSLVGLIPVLLQGVTDLIMALVAALPVVFQAVITAITTALPLIGESLGTMIPMIITAVLEMLPLLVEALATGLPLIISAAGELFTGVIDGILTALPSIIQTVIDILPPILASLLEMLPQLILAAQELFLGIIQGITTALPTIIIALVNAIPQLISVVADALPLIITAAITLFLGIIKGLLTALPQIIAALIGTIPALVGALIGAIPQIIAAALQLFLGLLTGLLQASPQVIAGLIAMIPQIKGAFGDAAGILLSIGKDIVSGLVNGIKGAVSRAAEAAASLAKSVKDAAMNALGINSPSRVFMEIGQYVDQGFTNGIKAGTKDVAKAMTTLSNKVAKAAADKVFTTQQNSEVQRILKANADDLQAYASRKLTIADDIKDANKKLEDAQKSAVKYQTSQLNKILSNASVADDKTTDLMVSRLTKQIADTEALTKVLADLKKAGIDDTSYKQLAEGGLSSLKSASALLAGGPAAIKEVGALQKQLQTSAEKFASTTSTSLFASGLRAAEGLVKGLESQQAGLNKAMTNFADGMVKSIKSALKIKSPSRVFRDEVGKQVGAGAIQGVQAMYKPMASAIKKLIEIPEADPARGNLIKGAGGLAGARYSAGTASVGTTNNYQVDVAVTEAEDAARSAQEVVNRLAEKVGMK